MDRNKGTILNIDVSSTSEERVLAFVRDSLTRNHKFWISTPNPEIILKAQADFEYLKILNSADIALPDGVGVIQGLKFLSLPNPKSKILKVLIFPFQGLLVGLSNFVAKDWLFKDFHLIKGRKMFLSLLTLANKKSWRVFLFGGEHGEAKKTAENLIKNYKRVKIHFAQGAIYNHQAYPVTQKDIKIHNDTVREINQFKPHLLFVALGAPKQEKWLNNNFAKLDIGGAMVVGGTLNYLADKSVLPPGWIEKSGLEWFWRLLHEPKRINRILSALIIFPLKVFVSKLNQ
jgi:N-acetylglucosaminyldiphosphoundecaprenol N-acetyl-beta-D-mannosaminyltransferase